MYSVILEYDDGRNVVIQRDVDALGDAATLALDLADRASRYASDGHGPPQWVKIYQGDRLEIAVSVVPGGLTKPETKT